MKVLIFAAFAVFFQTGLAQSREKLVGKIMADSTAVGNADVINANTNLGTVTRPDGTFSLEVALNDTLIIYAREYELRKVRVARTDYRDGEFVIRLKPKAVELDEVFVSGAKPVQMKFDQVAADQVKVERSARALKNPAVYDGTIENGADFVRMFRDIAKLARKIFPRKGEVIPVADNFDPTEALGQVDRSFYLNVLKLPPEEIPGFLNFCKVDSAWAKQRNVLELMDFLILKSAEYRDKE